MFSRLRPETDVGKRIKRAADDPNLSGSVLEEREGRGTGSAF